MEPRQRLEPEKQNSTEHSSGPLRHLTQQSVTGCHTKILTRERERTCFVLLQSHQQPFLLSIIIHHTDRMTLIKYYQFWCLPRAKRFFYPSRYNGEFMVKWKSWTSYIRFFENYLCPTSTSRIRIGLFIINRCRRSTSRIPGSWRDFAGPLIFVHEPYFLNGKHPKKYDQKWLDRAAQNSGNKGVFCGSNPEN